MAKILYAAGTAEHLRHFHTEYIEVLRAEGHEVITMARGTGVDINIPFEKKMFSPKNLTCIIKLQKIIKRKRFDAIFLNTTLAAFNVRMALGKRRPRVVNFVHGYMFSEKPCGIKEKIFLLAERILTRKTDSIMVMNEEDYRIATRNGLTRGEVVLTRGMGASIREVVQSAAAIRKNLASQDSFVICCVGELSRLKNQELLIRSLPRITQQIPNAVLWLIGKGKEKKGLSALSTELSIDNSVRFVGYVDNPVDYIRASDLYIAPSNKEGLPFNVLEALAVRKPIIATNVKGHRDLIENGVTGLLFNKNSSEELVENILDIYKKIVILNGEKQAETYEKYCKEEVFEENLKLMKQLMRLER